MKEILTEEFYKRSRDTLTNMAAELENRPGLLSEQLVGQAALIIIDMNNGFATEGTLYSPRIESLKPEVSRLAHIFDSRSDLPVLIINEAHDEDCMEFRTYPRHCVRDSEESRIIKELEDLKHRIKFEKNSTNGFLVGSLRNYMLKLISRRIRKFVVIGDCTDICIYQFVTTAKAYFNEINEEVDIIVPVNAVETFDLAETNHDGGLMNLVFLYSMLTNGINVVGEII